MPAPAATMMDKLRHPRLIFSRGKVLRTDEEADVMQRVVSQEINEYLREQERRPGLVGVAFQGVTLLRDGCAGRH